MTENKISYFFLLIFYKNTIQGTVVQKKWGTVDHGILVFYMLLKYTK